MAIASWQPAGEGATWAELNAAWEVLHTLILEAVRLDREERS
jgi:hypothetical protein